MRTQRVRYHVAIYHRQLTMPPGIGKDWTIYNAPRPLYGTWTWQDTAGLEGWFFAAVDPNDPNAQLWRDENRRLDACILQFVTERTVSDWAQEHYPESAKEWTYATTVAYWLDDHEER